MQTFSSDQTEPGGNAANGGDLVCQTITQHACLSPDKAALVLGDTVVDYKTLSSQSRQIAAALVHSGVGKGDAVAICMGTGIDYIIAMLGILQAGAAYIPLSVSHPLKRQQHIVDITGCRLVISNQANLEKIAGLQAKVTGFTALMRQKCDLPSSREYIVSGDDTACIIFTSGSSGTPKGVKTLHSNLAYYSGWASGFFGKTVSNKVPLTASIHFAAATSQIFSCLCAGQTLILLPDHQQDPQMLMGWYQRNPEYGLHCIPSVWAGCLKWLERNRAAGPKALFISGEAFPDAMWQRTSTLLPDMPVYNLYGPTESVANVSYAKLRPSRKVTIGAAIPGSSIFLVDDTDALAAPGIEGRLFISGPGICSAYIGKGAENTPILQSLDHPSGGVIQAYDTGDYARMVAENDIQFIGRRDQQIKLNGQRVELAEIENCLLGHQAVQNVVVTLTSTPKPRLVAYIESDTKPSPDALRIFLQDRLPPIMVPQHYAILDQLPRLSNGKIDRNTLPDIDTQRHEKTDGPKTPEEHDMLGVFERVTGFGPANMEDSFFAMGGNSLGCFDLIAEIEDIFGKQLDYKTIFDAPTPSGLLAKLDTLTDAAPRQTDSSHRVQIPMTSGQHGLWLHMQIHGDHAYNLTYKMTLTGDLDQLRFTRAFQALCARHAMLRSSVKDDGFAISDSGVALGFTDLGTSPDGSLQDRLEQLGAEPFSPNDDRLYRAHLLKTGDKRHEFVFVAHHIIFDGLSADRFFQELMALYNEDDECIPTDNFPQISDRESAYLKSQAFAADKLFWSGYLSGLQDQPTFPVAYKKDDPPQKAGKQICITLNSHTRQKLVHSAKNSPYSLHVIMLAIFGAAMFTFGRANEYVIAAPFANRHSRREQGVIGYLTNVLLYRIGCQKNKTLAAIMQSIASDTVQFLDHQQFPLEEAVAILRGQEADVAQSVFNLMFAYHDVSGWSGDPGKGLQFSAAEFYCGQVKCDLYLECFDNGETIELHLTYDQLSIDTAAAKALINKVADGAAWLENIIDAPLSDFAKPSRADRASILEICRGKAVEHSTNLTLHDLYRLTSQQSRDNPAIRFQGNVLSYRQLDTMVEKVAAYLWQLELAPDTAVAILMDHTPDMVASILACARLGIAYVPIDPTYPVERIKYITRHAKIDHILTASDLIGRFDMDGPVFHPVDLINVGGPSKPPENRSQPDDLLYIIYTSGSTGQPKGVMLPNKGVANYLTWMKDCFHTGPDTKILAKTSISFDISVWELFLPLISGGTLVLERRENIASPEQLAQIVRDNNVNMVQFVPSGLRLFCEAGMMGGIPSVKTIFSGGETLSTRLEAQVLRSDFKGDLINLYGPTEASIFASWNKCDPKSPYQKVPIGRPVANAALYILDDNLDVMPLNAAGDMYIGGDVLADGYLNDTEKTKASFIPAPPHLPDRMLYATGDQGRLLSNGMFEYLGRNDRQVKIRGHRVECQEIENLVEARDDISQAVTLVKDYGSNLHVVAVMTQGRTAQVAEVLADLRRNLPTYMVPSSITFVDEIPTLGNGKTDFKKTALLAETIAESPRIFAGGNALETTVFEIWAEVIGNRDFTLNDNFFDIGGHSVLFLKVRDMINERLQTNFNIADLYKSPNIASLIKEFKSRSSDPTTSKMYQTIRDRVAKRKARYQGKNHGK
jgi:tyrocidine synthetase-3